MSCFDEMPHPRISRHEIEQIGEPRLIIFDTLSKYMVGGNENESVDMGKVIENLDTIRSQTQATILVIHHTVKNGSSLRGSSTLPAACDVMFKLCKRNKYHTLVVDKQRDAAPTSPIHFEMKEYGDSLVPVSTERQMAANRTRMTKSKRSGLLAYGFLRRVFGGRKSGNTE